MTNTLALDREKEAILRKYRSLLRSCKPFITRADKKSIRLAFDMALDAHSEQRRKSGEPYIYHPIAVAQIVAGEMGLGTTSIVCALLHDTVEDTEMTLGEIELEFGKPTAKIIDGLTKISDLQFTNENTSLQAENFRKMLLTLADDVRVILIKLADRLHNMRTLDSMPAHKQFKIASETEFLYAPLAHRLGIYNIKTALEDLSLKYTNSEVYQNINSKLTETKDKRQRYIREFCKPIKKQLESHYPNLKFNIKGRSKSIHGIWDKMRNQSIDFEEVYDLFAIRIIAESKLNHEKNDCWQIYSIVTDIYTPNLKRLRDWISIPKANGYESLHVTVMGPGGKWVEVQIRTDRMDEVAEKGLAAHWRYKGQNADKGLDSWLKEIREILENPEPNALEFIEDFKLNLYNEDLFVFTPRGDLRKMPKGATALDFAFDIHSDIGMSCIGAKVNHKIVPLNYKLQNGDQVEILTSKIQKPKRDWLKFVVTGKAKGKIKQALNEEKRNLSILGKETLQRKLRTWKINYRDEIINKLMSHFQFQNAQTLYSSIALGKLDLVEIKSVLTKKVEVKKETIKVEKLKPKKKSSTDTLIIDNDLTNIKYELASCCNPIPGDKIFGFISVSGMIKVHRVNCPNASNLLSKYDYRVIKTRWRDSDDSSFLTGIKITGIDDVGIISNITRIISDQEKVNMRSISVETTDGIFEGEILLFVKDKDHLGALINKMKKVPGILKAIRFDIH